MDEGAGVGSFDLHRSGMHQASLRLRWQHSSRGALTGAAPWVSAVRRRNGRWQAGLRCLACPGHCAVEGSRESPCPSHTRRLLTGMWPGAPGKAGCRQPLMPVLPHPSRGSHVCSPGSPLGTAEAPWQLVFTGQPVTGLQEDVTLSKAPTLPAAVREQAQASLSNADSGALPGKWGVCLAQRGQGQQAPSPLCHHSFIHIADRAPPLPSFLSLWEECSLPPLGCARRASWRRS